MSSVMQQQFFKTHCCLHLAGAQTEFCVFFTKAKKSDEGRKKKKRKKVHGIDRTGGPVSLDPAPMMKEEKKKEEEGELILTHVQTNEPWCS
jgi:hypothetical protein